MCTYIPKCSIVALIKCVVIAVTDRHVQSRGESMGIVSIILCPAAIILAVMAFLDREKQLFVVLSFICAGIPSLGAINDMVGRTLSGDIGGIMDIYPTMFKIYLGVFIIVAVINILSVTTKDLFK